MSKNKSFNKVSIKTKSEILQKIGQNVPRKNICAEYNINKSTVSRIIKSQTKVTQFITNSESGPGKRITLKKCELPKMEKALFTWFIKQRKNHVPISTDILKNKAQEIHKKIQERPGPFHASNGWFNNFKKRHGIRMLKICGEKLSNNNSSVKPFLEEFRKLVKSMNLCDDQIYNADESGLFYKFLPDKNFRPNKRGISTGSQNEQGEINFKVKCFPPNCTALLQPMDQNVIKLTKGYYKKSFLSCIIADKMDDIAGKIKSFNLRNAVTLLASSWKKLDQNMIKKCWSKLLINYGNWEDEDLLPVSVIKQQLTDDQLLLNDVSALLTNLAPNDSIVRDDITSWLEENGVEKTVYVSATDSTDEEENEDIDVETGAEVFIPTIKSSDAVNSLNISLQWAEQNSLSLNKIIMLTEIRDEALLKSLTTHK